MNTGGGRWGDVWGGGWVVVGVDLERRKDTTVRKNVFGPPIYKQFCTLVSSECPYDKVN